MFLVSNINFRKNIIQSQIPEMPHGDDGEVNVCEFQTQKKSFLSGKDRWNGKA